MPTSNLTRLENVVKLQTDNINTLTTSLGHLSEEVENRPTRFETRGFSLFVNFITLVVLGALMFFSLRSTDANRTAIKNTNDLTVQIKDCITPNGKCYTDQQAKTKEAVNQILKGNRCEIELVAQSITQKFGQPYQLTPECVNYGG